MKKRVIHRVRVATARFMMATLMSSPLLFCATVWSAPASAGEPVGGSGFDALLRSFMRQATTPEAMAYTKKGTKRTAKNLMSVLNRCTTVGPDAVWPHMTVVLKINVRGVVEEARADSSLPLARCVEKDWIGMTYEPPPFAPFYRLVGIDAHDKRGV